MSPKSDRQRVIDTVRERVRSGAYGPGDALPSKRELAVEFGVSLGTIDAAMLVLKEGGWVVGHQGKAVYVADNPPTA